MTDHHEQAFRRKLRLYILTPSFFPAVGGQEIHLLQLAQSLTERGIDVRVIAIARESTVADCQDPVPVVRIASQGATQGMGWRSLAAVAIVLSKLLWRLLRDARHYDAVLVSGFNVLPLAPAIAGLFTGKPCVVRPESPVELQSAVGASSRISMRLEETSLLLRFLSRVRSAYAGRIDRYVAISAEICAGLVKAGIDPRKIAQIPNGIDVDRFCPVPAERQAQLRLALALPPQALLLIYTGRVATSKGVMMLMDVWAELAPRFPCAHLLIVGSGAECADDCEQAARDLARTKKIVDRVTFVGSVANVEEYLQASNVFVFPSDSEGFGLSIIEAMSVGLPMVCTRVGIAADLEASRGLRLLVTPQAREDFLIALRRLITEADLRLQLGLEAREIACGQFAMGEVARQHAELLSRLVEAEAAAA